MSAPSRVISCNAPCGGGGLGRHLEEMVDASRADGTLWRYYCTRPRPEDGPIGIAVPKSKLEWLSRYTPIRFSPGWRNFLEMELYDRAVAARLERPVGIFLGFGGQALHSFGAARRLGCSRFELLAANSHVDNVYRRHAAAHARYPIEGSWLNDAQRRKTLREYAAADLIYVASEYTRRSFLESGVAETKLRRWVPQVHPRYRPRGPRAPDGVFRVVYTGSLSVAKGVPLLVDAFSRLGGPAELTLVGGWGTRGMRRFLQSTISRDPRIRICPGDPLPHLLRADVCVHPTYEDGWAYAPAEALACGVPVIVTEDTGMKELITAPEQGQIIPTGDLDALIATLERMRREHI